MPAIRLDHAIGRIQPLDEQAMQAARRRQDELTKPPGSLGRLERLAIQLAGITRTPAPRLESRVVVIMAADHGVSVEGVSAYPSEVTAQMVQNFVRGGTAINVLARRANASVVVVDVGVAAELPRELAIVHRKIAHGTANLAIGPAMRREQALAAIDVGLEIADAEHARGAQVIALGEMGIGNTTAAAAIVAALTGSAVADVTGRGTGIDEATWRHKVAIIEQALHVNHLHDNYASLSDACHVNRLHDNYAAAPDALDVLARVGGFEIGGLVGLMLGAAAHGAPLVLDGFITAAAALIAAALCPAVRGYLIAAHRSVERGHAAALEHLELEPLLALDLRLGEGSGAALALPMLDAALAIQREMATFSEAGISTADVTLS